MSQELHYFESSPDIQEQFVIIERREKTSDWFFRLMIPAVFLFLFVGTIILLL